MVLLFAVVRNLYGEQQKKLMKFLICARSDMMGHLEDAESASCPYTLTSITHGVLDSWDTQSFCHKRADQGSLCGNPCSL